MATKKEKEDLISDLFAGPMRRADGSLGRGFDEIERKIEREEKEKKTKEVLKDLG